MALYFLFQCGLFLIAFGFPLVLAFMLILKRSHLTLIALIASFAMILALTLSSLITTLIPVLQDYSYVQVFVGVVAMELVRFVSIKMYLQFQANFSVVGTNRIAFPLVDFYSAIAAGVGYGVVYTVFLYGTVLINSVNGPATLFPVYCRSNSSSVFVIAAWSSLLVNLVHVGLMLLALDAFRKLSIGGLGAVFLLHGSICFATHVLDGDASLCGYTLPVLSGLTFVCTMLAFLVVAQPHYASRTIKNKTE